MPTSPRSSDLIQFLPRYLVIPLAKDLLTANIASNPPARVRELLRARGEVAWGKRDPDGDAQRLREAKLSRLEMRGTVLTWIQENEQNESRPMILRGAKLRQLISAKKKTASTRGGTKAIYAALAILTAEGEVALQRNPNRDRNKGEWADWIEESAGWMRERDWLTSELERANTVRDANRANGKEQKERKKHLVLDIGEGWGSIRTIVEEMEESVETIGVDRRGHTYTGVKKGTITAEVDLDLTGSFRGGVLKAIEKKAGRSIRCWTLVWLSPECSPLSIANAMNQGTGSAHGRWAQSEGNKGNATEGNLKLEEDYLKEAEHSTRNLLEALEMQPLLSFALENPASSDLWNMKEITEAMRRNPTWRTVRVDQCAYGRKSQKPTKIMTNLTQDQWDPRGSTGKGRCRIQHCAGTKRNEQGNRQHEEQTVPNSKEKRPKQGKKVGGRWEYTKQAVVNAVAAGKKRKEKTANM